MTVDRDEMLARKAKIDGRLAELKVRLADWRREAAATGRFRPIEEVHDLEAELVRLGQRSQKIQLALAELRRADKRGSNAWFEIAAREMLPAPLFLAIVEKSRQMRMDSLRRAGFAAEDGG